ncbi:MAG: Spy/CpxP family protein refolding chaperone [Nitrospiria bacterium]
MRTNRNLMFLWVIFTFLVAADPVSAGKEAQKETHSDKNHGQTQQKEHRGGGHAVHLFTEDWHDTLSHEQRKDVDEMHVHLMKETAPIKAEIKVKQIELAVLATQDKADADAIRKKIDEILDLKRQKMLKRYAHIVEMRHILSPEQRLSYDTLIVGRAARPKQ